jgi:hypothetical protein
MTTLALVERTPVLTRRDGSSFILYRIKGGSDDGLHPLPVPTVEAIKRDRSILDRLPLPLVIEVRRELAHALADVDAAIAARQSMPSDAPSSPPPDRAVRLKDAAKLSARSRDFLYHRWRNMGGFKDIDGRVKFPAEVIATWPRRDGNGQPAARPRKETTRDEPQG